MLCRCATPANVWTDRMDGQSTAAVFAFLSTTPTFTYEELQRRLMSIEESICVEDQHFKVVSLGIALVSSELKPANPSPEGAHDKEWGG